MKFPVSKIDITRREKKYVDEAMNSGWLSSKGPHVERFEKTFAEKMGTEYAVACSSGTTALTLALAALRIGPGDEVIVPEFTMIATAWAVEYLGATPVFVDCGDDLNIDVTKIEAAITERTKAIMPVHVYGRPCDMGAIMRLSHDYNLFVVEDCAEAHGAEYGSRKVGDIGHMGCFSLFANKIITAGEGGVITTDDPHLDHQLRHLRSMAFDDNHSFLHRKRGYNFRMTNLQAAVALGQTERLDEILEKRERIRGWYDKRLGKARLNVTPGSVLWMYDILMGSEEDRTLLMTHLAESGVETRMFFKPMSDQPCLQGRKSDATKARDFSKRGLYLPTHSSMTQEDVEAICVSLLSICDLTKKRNSTNSSSTMPSGNLSWRV